MQANIDRCIQANGAPPPRWLVGRRRDSASVPSYKFIGPARFSILLNSRTYQDLVVLWTYDVREKNRIEGCRNQNHHHQPAAVW
jgi:hypothetical protein